MLKQLCKKDSDWRDIAYKICKDKTLSDDLVNDMYIKLNDGKKSYDEINAHPGKLKWYVYRVINGLFIDRTRREKKIQYFDDFVHFEIEDKSNNETLSQRKRIDDALYKMEEIERQSEKINNQIPRNNWFTNILLLTSETSLRTLSKETGISVNILHANKQTALQKLKNIL